MSNLQSINNDWFSAVIKGITNKVKRLISEGAEVNAVDEYNMTPLHYAATNGDAEIVKDLLDNGADVNAVGQDEKTPLHWAAAHGRKDAVDALLKVKGIDVNAQDKDGKTPLHEAAKMGHAEIVKDLLDKGANVNAVNRNGETPLNLATNEEIRTLLIDTALLEAVKKGEIDKVKSLISEGADVNAYDRSQGNSLYWAVKNDYSDIAKVLLDNGANFIAYDSSRERHVLNKYEEVKAEHCKVSLHLAARLGNLKEVENLLREGADVNVKNDKGETPLHFAAESGYQQVVQALLDKGADVNIKDKNEKTPLNLAKAEEIKTLLQNAGKSDDGLGGKSPESNEGNPGENAGTQQKEKQEGNAQPESDIIGQDSDNTEPQPDNNKEEEQTSTTSAGQGTGVNPEHPAPVEPNTPTSTLDHDYADNSKKINIFYGQSKYTVNEAALDQNIHNVRTIFSECINDNVDKMSVAVLDKDNLRQYSHIFDDLNSIHVDFDSGNQVLVYSWPHYHQFDENKWNNFLLQLEQDSKVGFIGTGVLQFKYKDFNYYVYPPFVNLEHGEAFYYYKPKVLSFSQEEISKIIEDIKESHQSIEKKIIDHYQSLRKDFVENGQGYIHIKANIGKNNVKNFTDVSYTNRSDNIHNNPIEEAFINDNVGGNLLHSYVYENKEALMRHMFNLSQYNDDNINEVNANGKTPLHLAAKYGRGAMVEMLLNKGAKVDVVDSRGRTPLHWAAKNNNKEIVDALIKAGADVKIKDEDGKTPLDLAKAEEIKTLLQPAEESDDGSVDESSTDSEGGQEEEEEEEEEDSNQSQREQDISAEQGAGVSNGSQPTGSTQNNGGQTSTTSAEQGAGVSNGSQPTGSTQNNGGQTSTTSAEQGTGVQDNGVNPVAPTQTEEQPSSFFGSLFSILMKPFSLIASFFGGFFSWLFGSDEEKSDTQPYDDSSSPGVDQSVEQNNGDHNDQSNVI